MRKPQCLWVLGLFCFVILLVIDKLRAKLYNYYAVEQKEGITMSDVAKNIQNNDEYYIDPVDEWIAEQRR